VYGREKTGIVQYPRGGVKLEMVSDRTTIRYSANICAGSLKVPESRIVAGLLLKGISGDDWHHAMVEQNVLQARNTVSAVRIGRLVRQRLELMKPDLWRLVRDGSGPVATQAILAAAIKHSPLLGDFLDLVVREQFRIFNTTLSRKLFDDYLYGCRGRDPEMPEFNQTTRRKLQTTIYHILVQSGYLADTRTLNLQRVFIAEPVVAYLERNREYYVLRCMKVGL
jgi:hypothetical protein